MNKIYFDNEMVFFTLEDCVDRGILDLIDVVYVIKGHEFGIYDPIDDGFSIGIVFDDGSIFQHEDPLKYYKSRNQAIGHIIGEYLNDFLCGEWL